MGKLKQSRYRLLRKKLSRRWGVAGLWVLVYFLASISTVWSGSRTSTNYEITSDVLSGGGGYATSTTSNTNQSTIGQDGIIGSTSTSPVGQQIDHGVWPTVCLDIDGDGYGEGISCLGPDCDDDDPDTYPGAPELCDGKNNDCDGEIDEDFVLNQACDGTDSDLCTDGVTVCTPDGSGVFCDDSINDPQHQELCDELDNDCNPANLDGADEPWLGSTCDSSDTDLCTDDANQCVGGVQTCVDIGGSIPDTCDNTDNDCNPATPDGADEPWLGSACDGPDNDLCTDDVNQCASGVQTCVDIGGSIPDTCDNADNDCNPATPDGADEPWLGSACDGPDNDLCTDDANQCVGGVQTCVDIGGSIPDTCDNSDNDCNPATPDGADEPWLGSACDGPDTDLCTDDVNQCAGGVQTCIDVGGDILEICDGIDNNCDLSIDEGCDDDNDDYCDRDMPIVGTPSICPNGGGDCDDNDFLINPSACDIKNNGVDEDCDDFDRTIGKPCASEICDDGSDNDGDGKVDCDDPDCSKDSTCGGTEKNCKDGVDNDNDGLTDCNDSDCAGKQGCQ
jgi:hypothetical protein